MRRALFGCLALLASGTLAGCGNSVTAASGSDEPLQVSNGQFFQGAFPAPSTTSPTVSYMAVTDRLYPGVVGKTLHGATTTDALSVAIAFEGLGRGYWIVPVGGRDPNVVGSTWSATIDVSRSMPIGTQTLLLGAANAQGAFGPIDQEQVKVASLVPSGHVVASLSWGNNADLDLHVVAPNGKEIDPKHVNTTGVFDAGPDAGDPLPDDGQLDRDSNPACAIDGLRTENVVWLDQIPGGTYLFRVDMFSACGVPSTNFNFRLYVDGSVVFEQSGRLLDTDADGGGPGSGLYVGSHSF